MVTDTVCFELTQLCSISTSQASSAGEGLYSGVPIGSLGSCFAQPSLPKQPQQLLHAELLTSDFTPQIFAQPYQSHPSAPELLTATPTSAPTSHQLCYCTLPLNSLQ